MSSGSPVRVRFAPSPTGSLHVGGARSALFNYLFARRKGGSFILRIEDTDRGRYVEGAVEELLGSLRWLGLDWDEGPGVGGPVGPYVQSERTQLYRDHAEGLIASGRAYRCFCTAERLTALRGEQEKSKLPVGYDRRCRDLPQAEIDRRLAASAPHVIRLKIPAGRVITFTDEIRGLIEYRSDLLDDIVLVKSDGFPTYHLANVVDDHLMGVTHVLRGDEWITSTPRHTLLYEAFGWTPPMFAHLPVILAPDGGKLSKRKGAASVMDYKRAGYLPEALLNFLSLLGWSPGDGDNREKMSKKELIEAFSLDRVSPKAAVFDEKKLEWMNGLYMAERSARSLLSDVVPVWKERGWIDKYSGINNPYFSVVIDLLKVRSKRLTEIIDNSIYFFKDPEEYDEKTAKKQFTVETLVYLSTLIKKIECLPIFNNKTLEALYRDYSEAVSLQSGMLIHPTRLAISGKNFGPGLFELMEVLGKETVLRRLKKVESMLIKETKKPVNELDLITATLKGVIELFEIKKQLHLHNDDSFLNPTLSSSRSVFEALNKAWINPSQLKTPTPSWSILELENAFKKVNQTEMFLQSLFKVSDIDFNRLNDLKLNYKWISSSLKNLERVHKL